MATTLPPRWDLTDVFNGVDDPAIVRHQAVCRRTAEMFGKTYRGRVTSLSEQELCKAIKTYEKLLQDVALPETYAYLVFSVDGKNPRHGAFLQKMKEEYVAIYQTVLFFDLEIIAIDTKKLQKLIVSPILKNYAHFLERLLVGKPHRLPEREEALVNDLHLTGGAAFVRLFDEELAHKMFEWTRGKKKSCTMTEILDLLHHPDREMRKEAARVFTRGLQEESRRLAYILNVIVQEKRTEDRYRSYPSAEASRHEENQTTQDVVDVMTATVEKFYPLVQEFYTWKRELLGVKELCDYDRYAPLLKSKQRCSFEQAQGIVLKTFTAFSPEFGAYAQEFFDKKWIDARPGPGKMHGAFCMPVHPGLHPYLHMNFEGSTKDVRTLAHELGHCIHYRFARKQTYLNFHAPLTVAETASVFAEMLTFDHLRSQLKNDEERLALYVGMIEDIFATVFRQTAMYRFEQDLHQAIREKGEQGVDAINALWRKRTQQMFGTSLTITPGYDLWWSYISHIFGRSFYVYAYAFGELLTLSLFAKYQKEGAKMLHQYTALLTAGGSVAPEVLCQRLGFDLKDPAFWEAGMSYVAGLLKEARTIHARLSSTKRSKTSQ